MLSLSVTISLENVMSYSRHSMCSPKVRSILIMLHLLNHWRLQYFIEIQNAISRVFNNVAMLALLICSLIYWSDPCPHKLQIQAETHHCIENTGKVLNHNNSPAGTVFHTLSHHNNNDWNIQICRIWLHLCKSQPCDYEHWHGV